MNGIYGGVPEYRVGLQVRTGAKYDLGRFQMMGKSMANNISGQIQF